jgi:hypothetical protein
MTNFDYQKHDNQYIELLKDNSKIQTVVKKMLNEFSVPLQNISPIIYNYYNLYTEEENFFLE